MMTDNEKRAHEFTLCVFNRIADLKTEELKRTAIQNATEEEIANEHINAGAIDLYKIYIDLYKSTLELFNRDFPDGK